MATSFAKLSINGNLVTDQAIKKVRVNPIKHRPHIRVAFKIGRQIVPRKKHA
jgi:hypothetical protein